MQTFAGAGNAVATPNVAGLPTATRASWTINQFVFLDRQPDDLTLLGGFGSAAGDTATERYPIQSQDGICFWGGNMDVPTGVPYDLGKWQMVTLTCNGSTLTISKNGRPIKTADVLLAPAADVVKIAPVGPWPTAGHFAGKIAGFAIWNRVLTLPGDPGPDAEYAANNGLPPGPAPKVMGRVGSPLPSRRRGLAEPGHCMPSPYQFAKPSPIATPRRRAGILRA